MSDLSSDGCLRSLKRVWSVSDLTGLASLEIARAVESSEQRTTNSQGLKRLISRPIGPSNTLCMCSTERNRNGIEGMFTNGRMVPIEATLVRLRSIAKTLVGSMIWVSPGRGEGDMRI